MNNTDLWTFKYEPTSFDDMILDSQIKTLLLSALERVPNLLLHGPAGVGKGTFTHIFLEKTGLDYIWLNCSDETGIDNIRSKVKSFATSLGTSKLKVVVLNEGDFIGIPGQSMMCDLMEQVQSITRFILMCNYGYKIIPKLQSRFQIIEINNPPVKDIVKFVGSILKKENIKVKKPELIIDVVKKKYPDIRQIVNTLQLNVLNGELSTINDSTNEVYKKLFDLILSKDLDKIRNVVRSNTINYDELYQYLFDNVDKIKSPGDAIIEISEALYRNSFIAIKEINLLGFILKLMKKGCI